LNLILVPLLRKRRRWPALLLLVFASGCSLFSNREVLIGIRSDDVPLLQEPSNPDPLNTGIPSLDELNRKWGIEEMIPVYPDISSDDAIAGQYGLAGVFKLILPPFTDQDEFVKDYEADPHVEYAEYNEPATAFDN
jgi:hypothetical protein